MISLVVANCDRRVSGRRLTRSLADFAKLVESFDGHGVSFVSVTRQFNTPTSILFSPGSAQVRQLFEWLACVRGADKGFDTADFVADMRAFNVTPHVAQNTTNRLSAVDSRTTRHSGYEISQQKRKRVEEPFGWGRTIGGWLGRCRVGVKKLGFKFTLTMAAYDLKLPRLIGVAA